MEDLDSKETVMLCLWGGEKWIIGMEQVGESEISTIKR